MQNLFRSPSKKQKQLFIGVLVVGLVSVIVGMFGASTNDTPAPIVATVSTPAKPATSITYRVSGMVEAGEAVTLYAKRSGFIEQITVQEGDTVEAGAIVVLATDPLTASKLTVQDVAGELSILTAAGAVIGADQQEVVAHTEYEQSLALSTLSTAASSARAEAAKQQLVATLAQVEAVVPQALRFVQDNKTLFTRESMNLYTEVVEAFYKREPNYLHIGIITSGENKGLLTQVAEAKNGSSTELLAVSKDVHAEIDSLLELYARSESEFFDKDQLASEAAEFITYSNLRTSLAELSAGLMESIDGADALRSGYGINEVTTTASVALARAGKEATVLLRDITAEIETTTNRLSDAERALVLAELELGISEAPFSSIVTNVYVENGQYVEAGQPLVRLSGSGATEMKIKLNGAALSVAVGDAFIVDGKTAGVVDRIVPVLEAGTATAYIVFTETERVGEIQRGELMVSVGAGFHTISRDYLSFDSVGPYVVTKAGEKIHLQIVHDNGAELVVEGERELNEELVPAFGVRL